MKSKNHDKQKSVSCRIKTNEKDKKTLKFRQYYKHIIGNFFFGLFKIYSLRKVFLKPDF